MVDKLYTIKFTRSTLGYRDVLILDSQQYIHQLRYIRMTTYYELDDLSVCILYDELNESTLSTLSELKKIQFILF